MRLHAFLGIASQVSLEKREAERVRMSAVAAAMADKSATRVSLTAGEFKGHRGVLRSLADTSGRVTVLLEDGRVIQAAAAEVERVAGERPQAFEAMDAEHQQVARDHGFQAGVHTPMTADELQVVADQYLRSADAGMQALGKQMVANYEAIQAASQPDADFSRLAVFAAVRLRVVGPNQTEVTIGDKTIFFSYNTPVAMDNAGRVSVTNKKWSVTTSRHINKWLADRGAADVQYVPQEQLDGEGEGVQAAAKTGWTKESHAKEMRRDRAKMRTKMAEPVGRPTNKAEIKKLIQGYSPLGSSSSEDKALEDAGVSFFKCASCGYKYPEGRESDDDTSVCDVCGGSDVEGRLKAKRKYYSAEMNEGGFLNTGLNSKSKEELRDDLAELLADQNPDEDAYTSYAAEEVETLLMDLDCTLHVSDEPVKPEGGFGAALKPKAGSGRQTIADYKVEDIGIEGSQYFQGRGTGDWDGVFVGIGEDYAVALDDALDMAAAAGFDITPEFEAEVKAEKGGAMTVTQHKREFLGLPADADIPEDADVSDELYYHVALYINGEQVNGSRRMLTRKAIRAAEGDAPAISPRLAEIFRKADEAKAAAGASEKPKADAPKKDEPKADAPKKDEPKADAPKKAEGEAPKADAPKKDEPKKDEGGEKKEEGKASSMDFFKGLLEKAESEKAAAAPAAEKPAYPGVLKPTKKAEGPQAEEAWRLRQEQPDKVKEGAAPKDIMETEKRHESVDPEKLATVAELPVPVAKAVGIYIQCMETIEGAKAKIEKAAGDIKKAEGFEEAVALRSEISQHLDQFFREETGGKEFAKLGETFLGLVRKAMKMGYKWTDADLKAMAAQAAEMEKAKETLMTSLQEKAIAEGRVQYTEDRGLVLMPETESRRGEHAEGQPGTSVREKAKEGVRKAEEKQGTKASLQAGVLDSVKAVWDKVKSFFKGLTTKMKATNDTLEKNLDAAEKGGEKAESKKEEPKDEKKGEETKASLSPRLQALRTRALAAAQRRMAPAK